MKEEDYVVCKLCSVLFVENYTGKNGICYDCLDVNDRK